MNTQQLFETHKATKTVFQRKNGVLRALNVPVEKFDVNSKPVKPMFPISSDRNDPTT